MFSKKKKHYQIPKYMTSKDISIFLRSAKNNTANANSYPNYIWRRLWFLKRQFLQKSDKIEFLRQGKEKQFGSSFVHR